MPERLRHRAPRDVGGTPSGRRVLKVGPDQPLKRPSDAARVAQDNDIIEIEAGRYVGDVTLWTQNGLLLRGVNGRPHLDAQGRSAQDQGIWVFRGNDIVVENIEFSGARSRSRNGSGIRFFGRNLTVRDSYFHDNEDGVLTWTAPDSDILIERSVFAHNGAGDGQSHNIYIGNIRRFTLRFSHSHDSVRGHEVKSRARINVIEYNRLTDEDDGNSSYLVDLPEGGHAYVLGNVLEKGGHAENPTRSRSRPRSAASRRAACGWSTTPSTTGASTRPSWPTASKSPALVVNNVLAGAPAVLLGRRRHGPQQLPPSPGRNGRPGRVRFPLEGRLTADRRAARIPAAPTPCRCGRSSSTCTRHRPARASASRRSTPARTSSAGGERPEERWRSHGDSNPGLSLERALS